MGILRVLLAMSVLIGHSDHSFGLPDINNTVAVRSFYVISGFYMAMVLATKYASLPYYTFIRSRYLRLFPAYLAVVVLTIAYGLLPGLANGSYQWPLQGWMNTISDLRIGSIVSYALTNVFIFGQDVISYFHVTENGGMAFDLFNKHRIYGFDAYMLVPQAWTLGLELCFYLVAPFLVTRSAWVLAATALASIGLHGVVLPALGFDVAAFGYRFFPFELVYFCLGALAFKLYRHALFRKITLPAHCGLVVALSAVYFLSLGDGLAWTKYLALSLFVPSLFTITKSSKVDRFIGDLSYPIYISHLLVLYALTEYTNIGNELLGIAITLVLSLLIYLLVERGVDVGRERMLSRDAASYPSPRTVFACGVLVAAALAVPLGLKYHSDRVRNEKSIALGDFDCIATLPDKFVFAGFEPMETDSVSKWRWGLGEQSDIIFSLASHKTLVFTLQFFSLAEDQTVTIYFNNRLIETIPFKKGEVVYRKLPFFGMPEANVIRFVSADWNGKEKRFVANDPRPLSICFNILQLAVDRQTASMP